MQPVRGKKEKKRQDGDVSQDEKCPGRQHKGDRSSEEKKKKEKGGTRACYPRGRGEFRMPFNKGKKKKRRSLTLGGKKKGRTCSLGERRGHFKLKRKQFKKREDLKQLTASVRVYRSGKKPLSFGKKGKKKKTHFSYERGRVPGGLGCQRRGGKDDVGSSRKKEKRGGTRPPALVSRRASQRKERSRWPGGKKKKRGGREVVSNPVRVAVASREKKKKKRGGKKRKVRIISGNQGPSSKLQEGKKKRVVEGSALAGRTP